MSDKVGAYSGLVEHLAQKLAGTRSAKAVGADFDDLYQEGMIAVWLALESGVTSVGADRIRDRMRNYIRKGANAAWMGYERVDLDDEIPRA